MPETEDPSRLVQATSSAALLRELVDDSRELLKLEVALAEQEVRAELAELRAAAIAFVVAAVVAGAGLALALVAVVVSTQAQVATAGVLGAVLLGSGAAAVLLGVRALPSSVLGRTKKRLEEDVKEIGERDAWNLGGMRRP